LTLQYNKKEDTMSVIIRASYFNVPTSAEPGILGVRVLATDPIARPIHIALVLDTSGSMEGARIRSVKNTLNVLISRLANGDKISVVSFSSTAKPLLSNYLISDSSRPSALKLVEEIEADGGTNIELGISMLGSLFPTGTALPDSIVLLTDGFINEGISSVAGVYSLLNSYMPGVPVYSLGYGDDHNSDFMKGLSLRSNGTYTFIDNEIALPASIGDLLAGLQSEVAKNAELVIPDNWTCLELNYVAGNIYGIGSLIADRPNWAMFSVPENAMGAISLMYKWSNDNTVMNLTGAVTTDLETIEVCEQYMRCLSAVALDKASAFIKSGNLNAAKLEISTMIDKISNSVANNRPLAIRITAQLAEMNEEINTVMVTPPRGRNNHANLLLRTSGTATQYGQQRGVTSEGGALFSTPRMVERTSQMVYQYSHGGGPTPGDPDSPVSI
jgi:hypothetical protein